MIPHKQALPSFGAALPALLLAACASAPYYRVDASVRTLRAGARDAAGISPVAGAQVALECPGGSASRSLGKTDADGAFTGEGDGAIPLECKVAISETGYRATALAVRDLCVEEVMGACRKVSVRAMLMSESGASAGR